MLAHAVSHPRKPLRSTTCPCSWHRGWLPGRASPRASRTSVVRRSPPALHLTPNPSHQQRTFGAAEPAAVRPHGSVCLEVGVETKELVTFLILALIVVVIAVVARRGQVVQPAPGAKTNDDELANETAGGETAAGGARQLTSSSTARRKPRR